MPDDPLQSTQTRTVAEYNAFMRSRFILSDYVEQAMAEATYDKLADGSFAGRIPSCAG